MRQIPDPITTTDDPSVLASFCSRDMTGQSSAVPRVRIVETRPRHPAYLIPIAALTCAFVIMALAFSARLLDAIGSPISGEQLASLAAWSWGLAGIALTLLVWDYIALPRASRMGHSLWLAGPALLLSATVCCETTYLFGPLLIDRFVVTTTGAERECVARLRVLATARQDGVVTLAPDDMQSLLLAAPIVGMTCDGLPAVSLEQLSEALRGIAARRLGTAEQVYDSVFIPSVRSLRDAYNSYVVAQIRLVADIGAIPGQQAQAWQQYQERLVKDRLSPGHIPRRDWPQIAADVRAIGVPVPSDWNPADRTTFMATLAVALRHAADTAYDSAVTQDLRQTLPPGLSWKEFCDEPTIQARWRTMVDAPAAARLSPDMGFPTFKDTIYESRLNDIIRPRLNDLLSSAGAFAPRGRLAAAGHAGAAWAIIPTVLLYITVLFMLLHTSRLTHIGCLILLPNVRASAHWAVTACMTCVVLLALTWPALRGGTIQPAATMQYTAACASRPKPCHAVSGLPLLWAVGSDLRNTVLAGFDFGYNAALSNDQSEAPLMVPLPPEKPTL